MRTNNNTIGGNIIGAPKIRKIYGALMINLITISIIAISLSVNYSLLIYFD